MTDPQFEPGLYLVSTPIGASADITLRALDLLRQADLVAAEDTRSTRKLLEIHGIRRDLKTMIPYHDHNGAKQRPKLLEALSGGAVIAYVSDAGTPLVADPGFDLARAAADAGHLVTAAPGASALLAALAVAGLPTDRFMFGGFAPAKSGARSRFFREFENVFSTLVFYESPRRLEASLKDMTNVFGADRQAAICRELTKKYEQVLRGTLLDLAPKLGSDMPLKGEFVVVLGPPAPKVVDEAQIDAALNEALATMSVKDAAAQIAKLLGVPRKQVYARALALAKPV